MKGMKIPCKEFAVDLVTCILQITQVLYILQVC